MLKGSKEPENKLQYGCNSKENIPSIYQAGPEAKKKNIKFSLISAIKCTEGASLKKQLINRNRIVH